MEADQDTVVDIQNLTKVYRLADSKGESESLAKEIFKSLRAPLQNFKYLKSLSANKVLDDGGTYIKALNDVSFKVQKGEVIGLIGKNGSGKSTLLKILSKITPPSEGRAIIKGNVSSLLEVGTGFHPDLSGRENIYLNGTILGMSKAEISRKMDDIIEFSGIAAHIETPIKRYSIGMKVRLAFSVAAHLDPDILIVDEVLAVGDAEFQTKCLNNMEQSVSSGRTIFFVSHDLGAVRRLCTRAVWLNQGNMMMDGDPAEVVPAYLAAITSGPKTDENLLENTKMRIRGIEFLNRTGNPSNVFTTGDPLLVRTHFEFFDPNHLDGLTMHLHIKDSSQNGLIAFSTKHSVERIVFNLKGHLTCHIPQLPLLNGTYFVTLIFKNLREVVLEADHIASFTIAHGAYPGYISMPRPSLGPFVTENEWTIEEDNP